MKYTYGYCSTPTGNFYTTGTYHIRFFHPNFSQETYKFIKLFMSFPTDYNLMTSILLHEFGHSFQFIPDMKTYSKHKAYFEMDAYLKGWNNTPNDLKPSVEEYHKSIEGHYNFIKKDICDCHRKEIYDIISKIT